MGTGQRPNQKLQRGYVHPGSGYSFFHRCTKKVRMLPPKEAKKARIKARTRAKKARVKVKVRTKKVDRTRSPPFRLVLGRIVNLLLCFFASLPCSWPRSPPFRTVRGLSSILCSLISPQHPSVCPFFSGGPAPSAALHHLGWPWLGAPSSDAPTTCSCSRSPPFRTVRELSTLFCLPPLHTCHTIDLHLGETVPRPALHHLGWPWHRAPLLLWLPLWVPEVFSQSSSPPLRLALDREYPLFTSLFSFFSSSSPPLWPPRPQESKVIQIQRDHLLAASPPVAAMDRSKVTCSIQVCWRKLGPHQEGFLLPSHEVHWTPCWLGSSFSSSSSMLLLYTNDLLTLEIDKLPWCLKRVWSPSLAPPSLFFWRASGLLFEGTTLSSPPFFLHVLLLSPKFILGGYCTHWRSFSRCLLTGCHWLCLWFPTFWTTFLRWSGWASLLARGEHLRGLWVLARCMLVFCLTRSHKVLGWSSCLALSNQQACVRPCFFTGRLRPLGTGFFNGSMVLSFDLLLPPLRFLPYGFLATGSPRLAAF